MKWMLALLPAVLQAHMVSMSSGELRVTGNRATFDLRMPLYEIEHVKNPETALFSQLRFNSGGVAGKLLERTCREEREDGAYRCKAAYEWPAPVEEVDAYVGFHKVTVPNHVHLLHAFREDKSDQLVFDFSNAGQLIRFRPPTAFETWMTSMGSGFARVFSSAASVLFLGCLVMAARHRRELWWIAAAFLLGEIAAALAVPHTPWNPAPKFVDAAMALTVAYLAVEILLLPEAGQRWLVAAALGSLHGLAYAVYLVGAGFSPAPVLLGVTLADILTLSVFALLLWKLRTWFPALAATALRISAAVLLVTGLAWFCLQLR
jgi:hypothetical protein